MKDNVSFHLYCLLFSEILYMETWERDDDTWPDVSSCQVPPPHPPPHPHPINYFKICISQYTTIYMYYIHCLTLLSCIVFRFTTLYLILLPFEMDEHAPLINVLKSILTTNLFMAIYDLFYKRSRSRKM